MAAFSHQYPPFLVDSSSSSFFIPNNTSLSSDLEGQQHHIINNTTSPPLHHHHHHQFPLQYHQETSSSCTVDPSPFVAHQNISPEASMVVDKLESGEQVTQKITSTPMENNNKRKPSLNNSPFSKDSSEGRNKKQKKSNGGVKLGGEGKAKAGTHEEDPPTGYIHVRARRGQATDSHSLAERVRREKISERMKMLQRLVPGCDKVTGKALVLDEIINYVQSLQNQVEFLSMKLASMNPLFYDFAMDLETTLLVRPDLHDHQKLNSIASPPPSVPPQCSPNQATTFADATTTFPTANSDYLLDYSSPVFLQGQRSNVFSEYSGGQLWEGEDQRQKLLHPYGFGNNLCSLN